MPQIPRFFFNGPLAVNTTVRLDADTAKHIWQVLRMDADDRILLTDGNGNSAEGTIHIAERHKCDVTIDNVISHPRQGNILHLCVAFTKNNSRNEWLLEKATELGAGSIVPIDSYRSEKTHVRSDRWNKILQSAILQSQQYYLPRLHEITPLYKALEEFANVPQKFVAHCIIDEEKLPLAGLLKSGSDAVIMIGPEGDFSLEEVNLCKRQGFVPVSLGTQRLRTETAGIMAAAYFNLITDAKI